jgi:hypothetical protein
MTLGALLLLGMLSYFNLQQRCRDLRRDACVALAGDAAEAIQQGLDLGLHLADLDATPEILKRNASRHDAVLCLAVYNRQGRMLHATDSTRVRRRVPDDVQRLLAKKPLTRTGHDSTSVTFLPLVNSYGQTEGTLAVEYVSMRTDGMPAVRLVLLLACIAVSIIVTAIAYVPARRVLRAVQGDAAVMSAAIAGDHSSGSGLASEVAGFRVAALDTIEKLDASVPSSQISAQLRGNA